LIKTFHAIVLVLASASMATAGSALVEQGNAVGQIMVPDEATTGETFTAEELQIFVQKMSGATLPIVKASEAGEGPAILVGHQPGNQAVIDELNQTHGDTIDAFAVVGKGDKLSIVGRSDTSTAWAAWQWLSDQGVVWVMPGPHGTHVPQKSDIEIVETHDIQSSGMTKRGGGYFMPDADAPEGFNQFEHGITAGKLFALRMRFNENLAIDGKDMYRSVGSGHSYEYYLPPSKYFEQHPEWFNLIGGQRQGGYRWQLCFTNEEGAKEFARNVMEEMRQLLDLGVPIERMRMAISPNDFRAMCECENCRKLIDKDGSASSLVTHYCNLVTAEIHKVYPKAITTFYVYDNYSTAPDHAKPGPGVLPGIVFWSAGISFAANSAHPMFSEANEKYREGFAAWEAISDAVTVHTYYGHYTWFTPWPLITQMAHYIPLLVTRPKFQGMYSELHLHWGTQGLNLWLYPKLMWNPKLDVKKAIKTYCQAAHGPAAEAIQAYYQTVQESMDRQGYICGYAVEIPHVLTPEVVSKVDGYISQAEGMLDQMDPDTRWRTELVCQSWRASAQFAEAARLFVHGSGLADREKILALCDEVDQFSQLDLGKWAFERTIVVQAIGSVTNSLKVNLDALPVGKQVFNDSFNMGGAIKFFARSSGWQVGMWGYSLPVNGSGEIELPLRAEAGHRITSARLRWQIANPERVSGTLSVVPDSGKEVVLTKDVQQMAQGVDVPAEALDGVIQLKLRLLNQYHDSSVVLTGCNIEATVE
jgi:hypothetical protein